MHLLSFFFLFLAGCGYHFQDTAQRTTISIPYVKGDNEGQLTSELVHLISESGAYEYVQNGGNLVLQVSVVGDAQEKIGFQYDRKEFSKKIKKDLQPNENRRTITVEVSLLDVLEGKTISGPFRVSAFSEYDYVNVNSIYDLSFVGPGNKRTTVLNFSLGQLDSIEGAQDDAIVPLYRQLAQKIIDNLIH